MRNILGLIALVALCTAGCDNSNRDADGERAKTGYEQSLERAREVEDQTREAAERTERAIEEIDEGGN